MRHDSSIGGVTWVVLALIGEQGDHSSVNVGSDASLSSLSSWMQLYYPAEALMRQRKRQK